MKQKNFSYLLLFALSVLILTTPSCLPERKLAMQFAGNPAGISVLVFPPDYFYKFNHKGESIPGFDSLNNAQQDSALWVNSRYTQYLNDSILLEKYINHFIDELRALGFSVYLPSSMDSFIKEMPQSYIVNLAQIQLDEYHYPLEDEQEFDDTLYYKSFDLNAVDFSTWLELNKAGTARVKKTMLYSSHTIYDDFTGQFIVDPWTRNVRYKYHIDTLKVNEIYDMAAYLGKKHASYLFDYFLNQYVATRLPEGENMCFYYHYDRRRNYVTPVEDDRFQILGLR